METSSNLHIEACSSCIYNTAPHNAAMPEPDVDTPLLCEENTTCSTQFQASQDEIFTPVESTSENDNLLVVPVHLKIPCDQDVSLQAQTTTELSHSAYTCSQELFASSLWCISSVVMTIINKMVLEQFSAATLVLFVQILSCVLLLKLYRHDLVVDPTKLWNLLPCSLLFCINCYTSTQAIALLSVPTFNIIRNLQCFFSCPLDYAIRKVKVSCYSFGAMLVVLAGSAVYCGKYFTVDTTGFLWGFANIFGVCVYTIFVKTKFNEIEPIEMAWYNNVGCMLPITLLALYSAISFPESRQASGTCFSSVQCLVLLALSSIGCVVISVSSFYSQQIMSPITWLLLNNLNKIPSTFLAYMIWNLELGYMEITGLVISLLGGLLYSFTRIDFKITKWSF